jgi:hypothetical protein
VAAGTDYFAVDTVIARYTEDSDIVAADTAAVDTVAADIAAADPEAVDFAPVDSVAAGTASADPGAVDFAPVDPAAAGKSAVGTVTARCLRYSAAGLGYSRLDCLNRPWMYPLVNYLN